MARKDPLKRILERLEDTLNEAVESVIEQFIGGATQPPPLPKSKAGRKRKAPTQKNTPRPRVPNYYDVLEVSPTCSQETLSAAFRSLSKRYHPDSPTGDAEKYKRISEAWSVLKDPAKRKAYDAAL
jgi:hypothetical protein